MPNTIEKANRLNEFLKGYDILFKKYDHNSFRQCSECIEGFLSTNIIDAVYTILVRDAVCLKSYEVPVFSSFDDCTYNICVALDTMNNQGIEMVELGELLLQKSAKQSALYKYGESHFKTAQILGLACKGNENGPTRAYITNIGYYYLENEASRDALLTRLLLRSNIIQKLIKESANTYYHTSECMSMLSNKTINRRLPNVRRLVNELLNTNEYDFSEFVNKLDFDAVEIN